jgi:hypothetical protein
MLDELNAQRLRAEEESMRLQRQVPDAWPGLL